MKEATSLYLRGIPVQLVREAKAAAARRGSTLAALVSATLERSLDPAARPPDGLNDELEDDVRWFEQNRSRLVRTYASQWVAVSNRAVLDHDRDFGALAARVFARGGVRPVYIPRVEPGETRARIRSPRKARP